MGLLVGGFCKGHKRYTYPGITKSLEEQPCSFNFITIEIWREERDGDQGHALYREEF